MNRLLSLTVFSVAFAATAVLPLPSGAQEDQAGIAAQLLDADRTVRSRGIDAAQRLSPNVVGPSLRVAIIEALDRENRFVRDLRAGRETAPEYENDTYGRLVQLAVSLKDPATIEALSGALGTGGLAISGLAGFGEAAVPVVARTALAANSDLDQVNDALRTLRLIAQRGATRLSAAAREAMVKAAVTRLRGLQHDTVLMNAIDLAMAVDRPECRSLVERIAADPAEVQSHGVTDWELAERVHEHAKKALARAATDPGKKLL